MIEKLVIILDQLKENKLKEHNNMKEFWNKNKGYIIMGIIIIALLITSVTAIRSCSQYKEQNNNNIEALTDSIHTYSDKLGELVAYKKIIEGNVNDLKLLNDSLYNKIKAMKISGEIEKIIYIKGEADLPKHDTTWVISTPEESSCITRNFSFTDEYHLLEGKVISSKDSLELNIDNNKVFFDYTAAFNDDNQLYISSSNPYVSYNEITGLSIPKQKQKKWGIGPNINYGYNFSNNKFGISLGIGIQYNVFSF